MANTAPKEDRAAKYVLEVSTWKMAGVVVWHAALYLLAAAVWSLPPSLSPSSLITSLFTGLSPYCLMVYASSLAVLYAQRRILTTIDVPPLYVAKLGLSSKSWPALFLSRYVSDDHLRGHLRLPAHLNLQDTHFKLLFNFFCFSKIFNLSIYQSSKHLPTYLQLQGRPLITLLNPSLTHTPPPPTNPSTYSPHLCS